MKTSSLRLLCGAIVALTVTFSGVSHAGASTPNLVGTWTGVYDVSTPTSVNKSSVTIVVSAQQGANLSATRTWKRIDGSKGVSNGKTVAGATEKLLGVIGFDGKSVTFVESGAGPESNGVLTGKITGRNILQLIFAQPGAVARAGRLELRRTQ
ncbi:MAG: hypothetical protein ABI443_05385 [Chthoniobacterales bacterium]